MTEMQWRDISEAPKDGLRLLGWMGGIEQYSLQVIWWVPGYTGYDLQLHPTVDGAFIKVPETSPGYWACPEMEPCDPTHWMPLPPPPSDDHQAQGGMK